MQEVSKTSEDCHPAKRIKLNRPDCNYGVECFRRNPQHLTEFRHYELEKLCHIMLSTHQGLGKIPANYHLTFPDEQVVLDQIKVLIELDKESPGFMRDMNEDSKKENLDISNSNHNSKVEKNSSTTGMNMLARWEASKPFNFFLTKIGNEKDSLAVNFKDLFDPSLGVVRSLVHFNFLVETEWFLEENNNAGLEGKEILIIYGMELPSLKSSSEIFPWLTTHLIRSPFPYGHHHTKMTIVHYDDDSIRVIVYTANLIASDWENRTQGVWIGPKCPKMNNSEHQHMDGEARRFKADLLQYLSSYPPNMLDQWIDRLRACNFADTKVTFVGSAPTTAKSSTNGFQWGLKKIEKSLGREKNCSIQKDWPLIYQCSSIGALGTSDQEWFRGELGLAMVGSVHSNSCPIQMIYPSHENVKDSFDGIHGGGCLPYTERTHMKQKWLEKHLCQWKCDIKERTRAMPHIKTYCRISPNGEEAAWVLITSANLSKAAWGKLNKMRDRLSVMSWEVGILFTPNPLISPTAETFKIRNKDCANDPETFPLPFDLPLTKYSEGDKPWVIDVLANLRAASNSH